MGFLSNFVDILGGGSKEKGSASYQDTFSMLPQEFQNAYRSYASQLNNQIPNATTAYTPLQQTGDETRAFDAIRKGFAPTAETLGADISMFMNPFNDSVINNINRQANSDFSILKQNATQAGQFGSNRQMLGANDIEQTRQNNIGSLLQNQYNQAIGQVLGSLIPQRQQDAQGLLGIGEFQRNLGLQTNAAPITGLQQVGSALGILPSSANTVQTNTSSYKPGNPLQAAGTGLSILGALSDRRAKENIVSVGFENGWPIYEFSYINDPRRFVGVMADEVDPNAVHVGEDGLSRVDYSKIGVNFREII